jgi:predicted nucleic acid-binding protein
VVRTDQDGVVSDAGPIIHLDELGCLDLLLDLGPVFVPGAVIAEVKRHRPKLNTGSLNGLVLIPGTERPSLKLQALANAFDLHTGEIGALALLMSGRGAFFLTDDSAARLAGESLGFRVHGTIGIVVRALRRGMRTRSEVIATLRGIPEQTSLYIGRSLLDDVIHRVSTE